MTEQKKQKKSDSSWGALFSYIFILIAIGSAVLGNGLVSAAFAISAVAAAITGIEETMRASNK